MNAERLLAMPMTAWIYPLLGLVFYGVASAMGFADTLAPGMTGIVFAVVLIPVIFGAIFAAVYHAEVIAHWSGEPYGTLVLTAAVTVIEVALIASIMLSGKDGSPALARDTVYAVVMTVCTGLTGLCILVGGLRYREQSFRVSGASAYLTVLLVLATLTLILPNYTRETPGPSYSDSQLAFAAIVTVVLYGAFLYIQTVRHRDYFIADAGEGDWHSNLSIRRVAISAALLLVALIAVVLLSKKFSVVVEVAREAIGAPPPVTGLVVAILILLPEGIAAVRAARSDALQKSLNLALGSALATIGMTFPAVAIVALHLDKPLVLGLDASDAVLLALTLLVSTLTFATGRTNILNGFVHLVIFATFLFLTFQP
ncbi:ionic transporter y4hA [Bosea caraganae]|uniref:Ionic transporter y4hA n=1 Tax=Bosea caraganae TaxID=2763117 RepID=A0A370L2J0_9HYPH|nr:ionic transporter y4hA [Bosea caraganae]RDJ22452.1 ionic transporter y4hA [Bosea caraganae]RDJ30411.1 ionic transporter y4hA [Bosea caraganae]